MSQREQQRQRDGQILRRLGAAIQRDSDNVVRVRYIGFQEGAPGIPGIRLYNTVGAAAGLPDGTTITLRSLIERGLAPEVVR